jgi:hypothetical protein
MPANPPYIPAKNADILTWLTNFSTRLTASPTTYGKTAGDATAVAAQQTAYAAAYTVANNPVTRTPVAVAALDAAKSAMLAVVRPMGSSISANPAVSSANKTTIGVTVRTTIPTPIPGPAVEPIIALAGIRPLQVTYQYRNADTPTSKKKPYGSIGVQVAQTIATIAATDPNAARVLTTATKSPFNVAYDPGDVGKMVTVWARFVTRGGPGGQQQAGPWSAPVSHVIV